MKNPGAPTFRRRPEMRLAYDIGGSIQVVKTGGDKRLKNRVFSHRLESQ
jgi:hypothetical protein